jgi:hypothetical protein
MMIITCPVIPVIRAILRLVKVSDADWMAPVAALVTTSRMSDIIFAMLNNYDRMVVSCQIEWNAHVHNYFSYKWESIKEGERGTR